MKPLSATSSSLPRLLRGSVTGLLCLAAGASALAADEPAQKPLLSVASGAKPNLMVTLDNSGSMGYSYHETYGVLADTDARIEIRRCAAGRNHTGVWNNYRAPATQAQVNAASRVCYDVTWGSPTYGTTVPGIAYPTPRFVVGSMSAQRSPQVNPVYYNPSLTFRPRVDASGNVIVPTDGLRFVSNQVSINLAYEYRNDNLYYHSTLSTGDNALFPRRTGVAPAGAPAYGIFAAFRVPQHVTYTNPTGATPGFTSVRCTNVMTNPQSGMQDGCSAFTTTTITFAGNASITSTTCNETTGVCATTPAANQTYIDLPAGHSRTDCNVSGNTNRCTVAQEINNVLNWYRYYFNRQEAATSAIGQALANPDLDKEIRVGYMLINRKDGAAMNLTPGVNTGNTDTLRGVRRLEAGSASNTELYNWLYRQTPRGGTPLHNAVNRIATYYSVGGGARENPWTKDPSQLAAGVADSPTATNPEMSCRRSFNLLFSDGAWNDTTTSADDYDNTSGGATGTFSRTLADGSTEFFTYQPNGINTSLGRKMYTPYPSSGTGGLADLTAKFFWHRDQRPDLKNGIVTRPGQPTFWQNIATYTVGYQIEPISPLTFDQIKTYQTEYAASGYAAATKPSWPTGSLSSNSGTVLINDFIHAGYTGGGRGFSARSADDVRGIFETILSEILNSSGSDAGEAVSDSTSGTESTSLDGRTKYSVSYNTNDNSGDVLAKVLDEDGKVKSIAWTASAKMPGHADRNVFTISEDDTPVDFKGNFSSLPSDVQDALKNHADSARIANDSSFVDYLRGKDPVSDPDDQLFRQRSTPIGAMVNPPSVFMGGNQDMIYDLTGNVDGAGDYQVYMQKRRSFPASLFAATNAGVMHALNAETGVEMAGYMPRRSLKRMLDYANANYDFSYILDGPIAENDFYVADPDDDTNVQWQHVAIGTGGRGEKLVYAVRSPLDGKLGEDSASRIPTKVDFLWETGPDKIDDTDLTMGYVTTPAVGGQTENGQWVTVLPSGHYNGETFVGGDGKTHNKKNGLIVLDARTGELVRNIALPDTYEHGRGLGGVTLMRKEKRIVGAYAGDANGNMWRFDLRGKPSDWTVMYDKPIFTTENNRPIYGAPAWQAHPKEGTIVVFATGILLEQDDYSDTDDNEAIYGIWDPTPVGDDAVLPFSTRSATKLVEQTLDTNTAMGGDTYYTMSSNEVDWTKHHGWTFKLGSVDEGERNLDRVQNFGASIFLSTTAIAPTENDGEEICRASDLPVNYLYILDALTGTLGKNRTSFDLDDNGKGDGFVVARVDAGGLSRSVVLPPLYKTPDTPPTEEECKGDCSGYVSDSVRKYIDGTGGLGEDTEDPPCGKLGTNPYTPIADNCALVGWKRTQYQLSAPPAK